MVVMVALAVGVEHLLVVVVALAALAVGVRHVTMARLQGLVESVGATAVVPNP